MLVDYRKTKAIASPIVKWCAAEVCDLISSCGSVLSSSVASSSTSDGIHLVGVLAMMVAWPRLPLPAKASYEAFGRRKRAAIARDADLSEDAGPAQAV